MMRENKTYDEISVGAEASLKRVLTANDLYIFARASGDLIAEGVLGAKVPVILTSRADNEKARLATCAVAALYRAWQHSAAGARREAA
ncbi:MAG: hypothetical protein ACLPX9_00355 [Rhodomicrobium sp.]